MRFTPLQPDDGSPLRATAGRAVIRAIVRKGEKTYRDEFTGFADGWRGLLEGTVVPLTSEGTRGILPRGGTILGTSRTNPFKIDGGVEALVPQPARGQARDPGRSGSAARFAPGDVPGCWWLS